MRYFKTLQDILDFKAGTVIEVVADGDQALGRLGSFNWGWDIPVFIMLRNPEWFEEVEK